MRMESPSPSASRDWTWSVGSGVSRDWPKTAADSVIAARQSKAASRRAAAAAFGEIAFHMEGQDSRVTFMDHFPD